MKQQLKVLASSAPTHYSKPLPNLTRLPHLLLNDVWLLLPQPTTLVSPSPTQRPQDFPSFMRHCKMFGHKTLRPSVTVVQPMMLRGKWQQLGTCRKDRKKRRNPFHVVPQKSSTDKCINEKDLHLERVGAQRPAEAKQRSWAVTSTGSHNFPTRSKTLIIERSQLLNGLGRIQETTELIPNCLCYQPVPQEQPVSDGPWSWMLPHWTRGMQCRALVCGNLND